MQNSIVSPAILPSSGGRGEISSSLSRPFGASLFTARLLEGGDSSGALSQALLRTDGDLGRALFQQSVVFRSDLQRDFGTENLGALQNLSQERDPQLYFEGLLAIGRDLENHERLAASARVYGALFGFLQEFSSQNPNASEWIRPLQDRALQHLQAMRGEGSAGARFEFLSRRIATQASDPAMLFGMTAAGMAFRLTRVAALSRIAASPGASWLARGWVPRILSGSGAIFAESVAFTAGVRAGNAALGRSQDWSFQSVGREWASGALTLLGLRATGSLSGGFLSRLGSGQGLSMGLARSLVPQVSMLGGIMLSHRLETRLGLRPHMSNATEWTDAFATLLQFNVAGNLSRGLLGPRWASMERRLDIEAEALAQRSPLFPVVPGPFRLSPSLAFAGAGGRVRRPGISAAESLSELMSKPLLMSSDSNDSRGPRDLMAGALPHGETANENAGTLLDAVMTREEMGQLWVTLRMTPDGELRRTLISAMLNEAQRSPEAVAFLMSARDAEGNFTGREEVLRQIQDGLRSLDVGSLEEFATTNSQALRALLELGKAGNARALRSVQGMNFAHYAEAASSNVDVLVDIASPLRMAFESANPSALNLLRGLGDPVIEALSLDAQRSIQEGAMSRAGKTVQLLAVLGRSQTQGSLTALRLLREFPIEIFEDAEIEYFTIESLYLMAQSGNTTAAELLSTIELYSVDPGSAGLLLKLYRYGSESALDDLMDLAERGDLGAVSVLHDLGMSGLRSASEFLRELDPSNILRQTQRSDQALYSLGQITQHQNAVALQAFNQSPGMKQRLQSLLIADPYRLIAVVTPEMLLEHRCAEVEGFAELPLRARESISREIVEAWQSEPDKARYYRDNPTGFVGEDLIPRSFFEARTSEAVNRYRRANQEAPPPRRSETRPSDRPDPKKSKRFVN